MKRYTIISLFLAATMVFSACQKDENGLISLNVEVGDYIGTNDAKMYVDASLYSHWSTGDEVSINGYTDANKCSVDLTGSNATITGVQSSKSGYTAIYPAGLATSSFSASSTTAYVTLPSTQTYEVDGSGNQKIHAPMAARCDAGASTLTFHNLCSLLKVTVNNDRNENITLHSITVTSSSGKLSGSGSISGLKTDSPSLSLQTGSSAYNYVTLDFTGTTETVGRLSSKSYYIVVPAFTSSNITISIVAVNATRLLEEALTQNSAVLAANVVVQGPTIPMSSAIVGDFEGYGTKSKPFYINNIDDLITLRTKVNSGTLYDGKYFELTDDISCGENWTGIGTTDYLFSGEFDGNGKTISYSQLSGVAYSGLFKTAGTAKFKNLHVNCTISISSTYQNYAGGIVGQAKGTNFENCTVTGRISGASKRYGGIVGSLVDKPGKISRCTSNVEISSSVSEDALLGGIAGSVEKSGSLVEYCSASRNVTDGAGKKIGGIVGSLSSGCTIDNCTYTGTVTGSSEYGDYVGYNNGGTVSNCPPEPAGD